MIMSSDLKLLKMHGTGNDFLILDLSRIEYLRTFEKRVSKIMRPEWVRKVCDRHLGVGADGFIFIEPHETLNFQWDFYNSDGSSAEMCGNAARCVALYAKENMDAPEEMTFQSIAGPITAKINNDLTVAVGVGPLKVDEPQPWKLDNTSITFQRINSGVPHSVILVTDSEPLVSEKNKALAAPLRADACHGEKGSNVTFYRVLSDDHIESVSFERGVEDFTLACGTGVLAAGYHFCQSKGIDSCNVTVPGGELRVDFSNPDSPQLIGPAVYVAEVRPNQEYF